MELGNAIRAIRLYQNIDMNTLAESSNVSPSMLSLLENNLRFPSYQALEQIAKSLEVPMWAILMLTHYEEGENISMRIQALQEQVVSLYPFMEQAAKEETRLPPVRKVAGNHPNLVDLTGV